MQTSPLDADRALPEFDLLPVTVRDNLLTLGGADTELSMGVIKVFWLPICIGIPAWQKLAHHWSTDRPVTNKNVILWIIGLVGK